MVRNYMKPLVNREEMSNAIEIQNYYRIPSDKRNLSYNIYFSKGEKKNI